MKPRRIHGAWSHPLYATWRGAINRCDNKKQSGYKDYGGRGIKMCVGFRSDPFLFFETLGPRPRDHQLDRIDNDGHYSCGQCEQCIKNNWKMNIHWATARENCRNRRSNRPLTFNGKTMLLSDWAAELGISMKRLHARLKRGWSIEKTLSTEPTSRRGPLLKYKGEAISMQDFADLIGLSISTVKTRLTRGWSMERIANTPPQFCQLKQYKKTMSSNSSQDF